MSNHLTYQKIIRCIKWNASEAIVYHSIYLAHQMALFSALPRNVYGSLQTIFSLLYLSVWLLDVGLDSLVASEWNAWSKTKTSVYNFLVINITINGTMWACASMIGVVFFTNNFISIQIVLLVSAAAAAELLRRLTKTVLLLLFQNKWVALIEIIFITLYVACVWIQYYYARTLTPYTTIIPLLIASLIATGMNILIIFDWYKTLEPINDTVNQPFSIANSLRLRIFTYANSVGTMLFSSNFLVPLFATQFGVTYAGLLKIASTIVHSLTVVLQRTFGNTCRAALAHLAKTNQESQQETFLTITSYLYQCLYGLLIFCVINHGLIGSICNGALNNNSSLLLLLFFIITILDNFIITVEKLYEINKSMHLLCIFNFIGAIMVVALSLMAHSWASPILLLLMIAVTRVTIVALTVSATFILYRINPHKTVQPMFIGGTLIISLVTLFLTR